MEDLKVRTEILSEITAKLVPKTVLTNVSPFPTAPVESRVNLLSVHESCYERFCLTLVDAQTIYL